MTNNTNATDDDNPSVQKLASMSFTVHHHFYCFRFHVVVLEHFYPNKKRLCTKLNATKQILSLETQWKKSLSSRNVCSLGGRKENVVENLLLTVFRVGTMSSIDGSQFIHNRHNYSESNFHQHFFSIFRMNITVFVFNCISIAR